MKTTYATMHKTICLDKAFIPGYEKDGKGRPITYEVWQVQNGSWFPGHNKRDRRLSYGHADLEEAFKDLHYRFLRTLEDEGRDSIFWRENYQAARSKWQSWMKSGKTAFWCDAHKVAIYTSNGDLVLID